jgi:3-dehydroquinate synthase
MTVRHALGSYEIRLSTIPDSIKGLPENVRFITDQHVFDLYSGFLEGRQALVLSPGESAKSLESFGVCLSWLAETGSSRGTTVVALGGGVIGDLAGFVASAYMRGVPFHQIPTTLLAQVDSAVGGKVGVDLPEGKNLAGAFYPPVAVEVCPDALRTLPQRQLRNGMAEVLKYAFIMDPALLAIVPDPLSVGHADLGAVVLRCLELKAGVVEEDEHERTGRRAILNFGHTVGHAIEQVTGYGPVLHGEAISIGMVVESALGEEMGVTQAGTTTWVRDELVKHGLPATHESLQEGDALVAAMLRDKKASDGKLAFSLLTRLGECKLVPNVPEELVRSCLSNV